MLALSPPFLLYSSIPQPHRTCPAAPRTPDRPLSLQRKQPHHPCSISAGGQLCAHCSPQVQALLLPQDVHQLDHLQSQHVLAQIWAALQRKKGHKYLPKSPCSAPAAFAMFVTCWLRQETRPAVSSVCWGSNSVKPHTRASAHTGFYRQSFRLLDLAKALPMAVNVALQKSPSGHNSEQQPPQPCRAFRPHIRFGFVVQGYPVTTALKS